MRFDEDFIQTIWEKGRAMLDQDATHWRRDECGAWMFRGHYGVTDTEFGWKIEKVKPDLSETADSFRPFHYRNAYDIAVGAPHCRVAADRIELAPTGRVDRPRNREL
jgi:hypothetical protein